MYYFAQVCLGCIKNDRKLIKIHDLDVDNITFYQKLTLCLPNMIFGQTGMTTYLCQNCSSSIRKMYDFRELCINSEKILKAYILQLEQANSLQNSKSNLKELIENNYKDLTTIKNKLPESSEVKLEKFDSEIDRDVITTETLDFKCDGNKWFESNCLLGIKNEPSDTSYCQDYDVNAEYTDVVSQQDNHTIANKESSIQPPNTSETSGSNPLIEQEQIEDSEKRYKCDVCSKSFNYLDYLRTHMRIHTGEKPYVCDICRKSFSRLDVLRIHKRIHTGERPYECDECGKNFNRLDVLQSHKRIHTGEKPYACDVCTKCFKNSSDLLKHSRIHTGEKPYVCIICSKCFNDIGNLQQHMRIHSGDKPYECDVCSKCFNRLSHLNRHKQIHNDNKPYHCNICSKIFRNTDSLQKHEVVHTDEKPYECDVCRKSFKRLGQLKSHKRVHTGEIPYHCDVCSKNFKHSSSLLAHKRTHTSEKPYELLVP